MIGELFEVALDMRRSERRRAIGEQRVDGVPCHLRPVESARQGCLVGTLGEHRRHTRQHPRLWRRHVDTVLRVLEVVDIRGVVLHSACLSGDELCKFARKRDLRGLCDVEEGQFVEHVGEPLTLLLPVEVESPQCVVQWLAAHSHLGGERLLVHLLQRSAQLEVLREVILPVDAV